MGQRYTPGFLICDVGKAGKDISARLRQELLEQELENKQHTRVCVCVCVCFPDEISNCSCSFGNIKNR
jgi:hypothetical protein